MNKKTLLVSLSVLGLCIILAGGYLWQTGRLDYVLALLGIKSSAEEVYRQEYEVAMSTHARQDFDVAIAQLERLLASAPTQAVAADLRIKIASNYYGKGDYESAARYYWEVIDDPANPPRERALALANMAENLVRRDVAYYRTYFTRPPYNSLIPDETVPNAPIRAAIKLFEYSYDLYPTSYAKYAIANLETAFIANNNLLPGEDPKEIASFAQQYIREGDAEFEKDSDYRDGLKVVQMNYRANSLAISGKVLGTPSLEEREAAYIKAEEIAASANQSDVYVLRASLWLKFYHAAFLAWNYGEERAADIDQVAKAFRVAIDNPPLHAGLRGTFASAEAQSPTAFFKSRALSIASFSPTFKEFLVSVGWKL